MKKVVLTFVKTLFIIAAGFSQCNNCYDNSNVIQNNSNGTFTATSAQAYYWEIENCEGTASIIGSNINQTVSVNCIISGSVKVKVTRFVNGNCIEACEIINCSVGSNVSCPKNATIDIAVEPNDNGHCTGAIAYLNNVNNNEISTVNWSWTMGPNSGGGTTTGFSHQWVMSFPPGNWTNYYLDVYAEIVLIDGTVCRKKWGKVQLDCGNVSNPKIENTSFSISPNPSKENIIINSDDDISKVVIKNINGRVIKEVEYNANQKIDLSKNKNGIYFITVIFKNGKIDTKKLIKQ